MEKYTITEEPVTPSKAEDVLNAPRAICPPGMVEVTVEHAYNGGNGRSTYRFFAPREVAAEFEKERGNTDAILYLVGEYDRFLVNEYHNGGNDYEGQCVEVEVNA